MIRKWGLLLEFLNGDFKDDYDIVHNALMENGLSISVCKPIDIEVQAHRSKGCVLNSEAIPK